MLYNERMLETYLHAKKWLKPGGKLNFWKTYVYICRGYEEEFYRLVCTH